MSVAGHLLSVLEEFFEEISYSDFEADDGTSRAIDHLIRNVEIQYDGEGDLEDLVLIENTIVELEWIWKGISAEQKKENHLLVSHYEELIDHLEGLATTSADSSGVEPKREDE